MVSSRFMTLGVAAFMTLGVADAGWAADLATARSYQPTAGYVDMSHYFTWTGVYLGGVAGYGSSALKFSQVSASGAAVPVPPWAETRLKGGTLGLVAGANYQVGPVVFGVEGDLDWSRLKGSQAVTSFVGSTATVDANTSSYGTLRGRMGWAFGRVLPFVTGGLYWSQTDLTATVATSGAPLVLRSKSNEPGWVLGAGLEVALDSHWSVKGEWLHARQDAKFQFVDLKADVETTSPTDIIRGGVNYRF